MERLNMTKTDLCIRLGLLGLFTWQLYIAFGQLHEMHPELVGPISGVVIAMVWFHAAATRS